MSSMQKKNAVVLGGSVAGLLAAHVLSRHFAHVTLIERDAFPKGPEARKGVPQSRQLHGLLAGGRRALEALFPGFREDLLARGAHDVDVGTCGDFLLAGRPLPRAATGLRCFLMSRPLLEHCIRERVLAAPNIHVRERCVADKLLGNREVVRALALTDMRTDTREELPADLIVDATGRGSRMPEWLTQLGAAAPSEERVTVNLHYTSFYVKRKPSHLGGDLVWIDNPHPSSHRAGAALAVEDERFVVGLTGYLDEVMPTDYEGALMFAKSLRGPALYELLRDTEPVSELRGMRFAASQRRRYERLSAPRGVLVLGDALCSFNAVYGQGMTVAALEALALDDCLQNGGTRLFSRFQRAAAKLVDTPWSIVVGGDYTFAGVQGKRTLGIRAMNAFMERLTLAAASDKRVSSAFLHVMHMCEPPTRLFAPEIVWSALSTPSPELLQATQPAE